MIRTMQEADWPAVKAIYEDGIRTGIATFETKAPENFTIWRSRHPANQDFVCLADDIIAGWCCFSAVSDRCAYSGVAEATTYVGENFRGQGIGGRLLEHLITVSEENGIWTLQAGIFPENHVSLKLHEKYGFRIVGRREKIGHLNGRWRDVLFLERRSARVGL